MLHFWALEIEREVGVNTVPDPVEYLQRAYEETVEATTSPSEWYGTTTSVTALLHSKRTEGGDHKPVVYVTNLGDCKVLVIRPSEEQITFQTKEQWHWFDCPMQLGTNSIDTPQKDAALSQVPLEEDDIVLALSDGVLDNLWEQEVLTITLDSMRRWDQRGHEEGQGKWKIPDSVSDQRMVFVAREVLKAALSVAQDPFAESPYMEKAIDEGLAIEGGRSCPPLSVRFDVSHGSILQAKWTISASWSGSVKGEAGSHCPISIIMLSSRQRNVYAVLLRRTSLLVMPGRVHQDNYLILSHDTGVPMSRTRARYTRA